MAAYFFWIYREKIFGLAGSSSWVAIPLLLVGVAGTLLARDYSSALNLNDYLSLIAFSFCLLVISAFTACFGHKAALAAVFPLGLLLFFVPIPSIIVEPVISALQAGSALLVYWLFQLLGIPVLRDGLIFTVPGVSIEIARECSGINSSVALLITALLVAHETLRSNSRRILLVLLTLPLSIIKNAIRIVTLTLLATHVDMSFLTGNLHHHGGVLFFLLTLVLLVPIWILLKHSEERSFIKRQPSDPAVSFGS